MNTKRALKRLAVPVVTGGAVALALTGGASAAQSNGNGQQLGQRPGVIVAKGDGSNFRFSSTTIESGQKLRIANHTKAPHTLSLVLSKLVPQTRGQVAKCNSPGHICRKIAKWHKFDGRNIHRNPVRAGLHGWDEEGSLHRKGDSVVFNPGKNPRERRVTAPAGTVLHFVCAIHPNMHGRIIVDD